MPDQENRNPQENQQKSTPEQKPDQPTPAKQEAPGGQPKAPQSEQERLELEKKKKQA